MNKQKRIKLEKETGSCFTSSCFKCKKGSWKGVRGRPGSLHCLIDFYGVSVDFVCEDYKKA